MAKSKEEKSQDVVNDIAKNFNDALKKKSFKDNNVFERKVLIEKCRNGRFMSPIFLRRTEAFYKNNLHPLFDKQEENMENNLIELLKNFQISAMLKTDKRSLPYTNQIIVKLPVESDMNAMWNYSYANRQIIKELLEKNVYKIRFYVHIETYEDVRNIFLNCGIKYSFRYYIH